MSGVLLSESYFLGPFCSGLLVATNQVLEVSRICESNFCYITIGVKVLGMIEAV